jgi:NADH-quinone oxidoreductase subunit G
MADLIKLTIDGREIEVEPGTLILEAARRLGIEIPTFCYDERLKSVGACRMCLVEVEKSPKLVASCATPVGPGMIVKTESDRVIEARKAVLEFLLINHPLDCPTCDKGGECPLQNLTYKYGPPISRYRERKIRFREGTDLDFDDVRIGPEIWLNRNRCIICYKCVRIARDLAGSTDIGMFKRGAFAHIDIRRKSNTLMKFPATRSNIARLAP